MDISVFPLFAICVIYYHSLQICGGAPVASWKDRCSPCRPGLGVVSTCNGTVDTLCSPCPEGFYSNKTSAVDSCLVCSKCGEGLFELYPCNATHDVFCELCSWTKAVKNENYNTNCPSGSVDLDSKIDDYVNSIPADYFDYGKGVSSVDDDLMLGDQPVADRETNQTSNIIVGDLNYEPKEQNSDDEKATENLEAFLNISLPSEKNDNATDLNVDASSNVENSNNILNKSSADDNTLNSPNDTTTDRTKTNNTSSILPQVNNITDSDFAQYQKLLPEDNVDNETELETNPDSVVVGDSNVLNTDDVSSPDARVHVIEDGGSGSGDAAIIVGLDDDGDDIQTETETPFYEENTTTGDTGSIPAKKLLTLPPVVVDFETPEPTKVVIVPISVLGDGEGKTEVLVYSVGESKDDDGLPIFAIVMAVLTTGIIFFVLGFIFNRRRTGNVTYTPSQKYNRAPTKPVVANNYHEMKPLNSTPPITPPKITVNDVKESIMPKEESDGETPSESVPMLPSEETYPIGNHQSPVDIDADTAEIDDTLEKHPLVAKYIPENVNTITNTGTTIKVDYDCRDSTLTGGPLGAKRYCLNHVELRWGKIDSRGSEHTINGIGYSAEIQLVHWNYDDCINYAHALSAEDGIAVLSVLVEVPVGQSDHEGLKLLTDCLPSIQYKSESRHIPEGEFDAKRLLPDNTCDYWTYTGSLTSPPYHESATWIVFKDHILVSHEQLQRFRRLRNFERDENHSQQPGEGYLVDNHRHTMPLNDRKITASFL